MELHGLNDVDRLEEALEEHRRASLDAEQQEEWAREEALREQQQQEWLYDVMEPEQFCLRYLTFRSLYFDTKLPSILPQLVEQALDLYLLDHSISRFMGLDNITETGAADPPGGNSPDKGGSGPIFINPAAADQIEPRDILIDYNERFKAAAPTLFRDEVISQVMSVLIGKNKPNALLTGPAGSHRPDNALTLMDRSFGDAVVEGAVPVGRAVV